MFVSPVVTGLKEDELPGESVVAIQIFCLSGIVRIAPMIVNPRNRQTKGANCLTLNDTEERDEKAGVGIVASYSMTLMETSESMSMKSKREYLQRMRWRYGRAQGRGYKSRLIEELVALCGSSC
jgi:hypothetical protein